jgi:4-hydroxy-3-polyprenylbenzoate decarboxylase
MNLVVALTGATGAHATRVLIEKSPWPVSLVSSAWGLEIYKRECGPAEELTTLADEVLDNSDLAATISSGSVPTAGMVILPCTTDMLGKIAAGIADTLISRAAHCHLKEKRPLVICLRETPLTAIDLENAHRLSVAGAVIMPLSPPFYMFEGKSPDTVTMNDLFIVYVDRILGVLGHAPAETWENHRELP